MSILEIVPHSPLTLNSIRPLISGYPFALIILIFNLEKSKLSTLNKVKEKNPLSPLIYKDPFSTFIPFIRLFALS